MATGSWYGQTRVHTDALPFLAVRWIFPNEPDDVERTWLYAALLLPLWSAIRHCRIEHFRRMSTSA